MSVKGELVDPGSMSSDDSDVPEKVAEHIVKRIRGAIKDAVDDMEIEIVDVISTAVDAYMKEWMRTNVTEEAYISIWPRADKVRCYISLPVANACEEDPAWMFDLDEALRNHFDDESGNTTPLTPAEREATIKTRDAFQRIVDFYNNDLEKRK